MKLRHGEFYKHRSVVLWFVSSWVRFSRGGVRTVLRVVYTPYVVVIIWDSVASRAFMTVKPGVSVMHGVYTSYVIAFPGDNVLNRAREAIESSVNRHPSRYLAPHGL